MSSSVSSLLKNEAIKLNVNMNTQDEETIKKLQTIKKNQAIRLKHNDSSLTVDDFSDDSDPDEEKLPAAASPHHPSVLNMLCGVLHVHHRWNQYVP